MKAAAALEAVWVEMLLMQTAWGRAEALTQAADRMALGKVVVRMEALRLENVGRAEEPVGLMV